MQWRSLFALAVPTAAFDYEVTVPGLGVLQGRPDSPGRDDGTRPQSKQYPNLAQFLGIPYAKPPVGDLRFQPPQPYGAWDSPRDATNYGSACWQGVGEPQPLHSGKSEDCLLLHVVTPSEQLTSTHKLPVMFYIHGGAYQSGEASDYPLDAMVAQNNYSVVAVAANYRLAAFGFLGGYDVQARTSDGSSGNFGIQDQRSAMTWVKQNIAAFGGNGDDITIFGESAGGNSVMNHLAQPASFPLYQKAIIESGTYSLGATTLAASDDEYQKALKLTGCQTLDCVVALPAETLNKLEVLFLGPVVDNVSLTAAPWDLILQGEHNKDVPVMLGSNRDEAALITYPLLPKQVGEKTFDLLVTALLGVRAIPKVKKLYDPANYDYPSDLGGYSQWWWTITDAATDTVPGLGPCGVRSLARALLQGGTENVYTYFFSKPSVLGGVIVPSEYVVGHATEIIFAFGDVNSLEVQSEKELAIAMSSYWSSFAIHGAPTANGLPSWPLYDAKSDTVMRFDDSPRLGGVHTQQALRQDACDFWDEQAIPRDLWEKVLREALQQSQPQEVVV